MKLINSSFEVLPQAPGLEGMYKQIEIGARNCYKSEDKITEGSAEKLVEFLKGRGHYSPLEHGTVYLKIPRTEPCTIYHFNPYCRININGDFAYVTTNYRVIIEHGWDNVLEYICEPTEYHEKRVSVMVTCAIGISREFNRHKICALYQ